MKYKYITTNFVSKYVCNPHQYKFRGGYRKRRAITYLLLYAFMAGFRVKFTFLQTSTKLNLIYIKYLPTVATEFLTYK